MRSYLAAEVNHGRTVIAWVWDVYDQNQQRALRLSGEEPAGKSGRDAWAAADDLVLRKIAQAGLSGLSGMDQWYGPGRTAARPGSRAGRKTGPRGRECATDLPRFGRIQRQRARLQRALTQNSRWPLILRRKT